MGAYLTDEAPLFRWHLNAAITEGRLCRKQTFAFRPANGSNVPHQAIWDG